MEIIGIEKVDYTNKQGKQVSGRRFFFRPFEIGDGEGYKYNDPVFVTNARLMECSFKPAIGDDVRVCYNRFGGFDDFLKL